MHQVTAALALQLCGNEGKINHLSCIFFCFQMISQNSLDPDQARHNVGPDLVPNCLTL